MYIKRIMEKDVKEGSKYFPVVAILGPRQSGKTTLAKKVFSNHKYISLEDTDIREVIKRDPRSFLKLNKNEHGIIIDEFQHVPDLLSYIQTFVDKEKKMGYFILTGSQNFLMNQAISQTLAGRISIHTLLPLSIEELKTHKLLSEDVEYFLSKGFYPAIYDRNIPQDKLYSQYLKTYIERDVRQLAHVGDLTTFQTFLTLCAQRVGQLLNYSELSRACRISDQTVRRWLSILEASYIIFLLHPYHKNMGKRLIKTPKLHFYDTGLVSFLLKIKQEDFLLHNMRGNIFESFVISEIIKNFYNKGKDPNIYFWRDRYEHEVDCVIEYGTKVIAIEVKAKRTFNSRIFQGLSYWNELNPETYKSYIVHAANKNEVTTSHKNLISWQNINEIIDFL